MAFGREMGTGLSRLRDTLTQPVIDQALKGPSGEIRARAVQKIGRSVRAISLTPEERDFAERLFDRISRDINEEVRRALAITLRVSPNLPRSVANRLLDDVDSIAVPILSSSPVVTDDDLLAVIQSRIGAKIRAVAERASVSAVVSRAVISSGEVNAIASLAANDGAIIMPDDAKRLVEMSQSHDLIREAALQRADFPMGLSLRLIDRQIETMDGKLGAHHALKVLAHDADDIRSDITDQTASRSRARFLGQEWSADVLMSYVQELSSRGHLSEDVIARAAGQGDWRFVQLSLALKAGISPSKAGLIAFDRQSFPLAALCLRAGLSTAAQALLQASREAFKDIEASGKPIKRRAFQRQIFERIASHPDAIKFESAWIDWLDEGLSVSLV